MRRTRANLWVSQHRGLMARSHGLAIGMIWSKRSAMQGCPALATFLHRLPALNLHHLRCPVPQSQPLHHHLCQCQLQCPQSQPLFHLHLCLATAFHPQIRQHARPLPTQRVGSSASGVVLMVFYHVSHKIGAATPLQQFNNLGHIQFQITTIKNWVSSCAS